MSSWTGLAETYRHSFATLCEGTVGRLLEDTSGPRHLDVGSGTGTLAARATAIGRSVCAMDADADMVALTNVVVPGRALEASVSDLPFAQRTFDAVTANFVINHVADPRAAMRELTRVTRPGGRVAATIWPAEKAEWAVLVGEAFTSAGVVPIPGAGLGVDLDFERSVDGLRDLAVAAGLEPVTATELTWDWKIQIDALWRGIAGGVATVGQTLLAQEADIQAAAEHEFRTAAQKVSREGVMVLSATAAYVVAIA